MTSANVANVYITNHRRNTVAMPVAPTDFNINYDRNDTTSNVIGLGEINRVGDDKLKKITISSVLPIDSDEVQYTTVGKSHRWKKATSYLTFLKNIEQDKKPVRLVITGTNVTMMATMTLTYGMANGNAQEYVYTLTFTEYRPFKAVKLGSKNKLIKKGKGRSKPAGKINRGSKVTITGKAYSTPTAAKGKKVRKKTCYIMLISKGAKHPYYVKATNGSRVGWVGKEAIK